jgi:DNA-binding response OmpR family regulator
MRRKDEELSKGAVLIVDDDADVRLFLRTSLEAEGYRVVEAPDGDTALRIFKESLPSAVLLDLMLGQPDGLEVCRRLRQDSNVPILMFTSRSDEIDEAMCLAAGVDDFVSKPVSGRIIALRVASLLRRSVAEPYREANQLAAVEPKRLVWGPIAMDIDAREVEVNSSIVALTHTEFDLLRLLMEHPRQVFTREQLTPIIGASSNFGVTSAIDAHASRLRLKIRHAGGPEVIVAVRGVGYRLSAPH